MCRCLHFISAGHGLFLSRLLKSVSIRRPLRDTQSEARKFYFLDLFKFFFPFCEKFYFKIPAEKSNFEFRFTEQYFIRWLHLWCNSALYTY